jgi:DNA modification methylase
MEEALPELRVADENMTSPHVAHYIHPYAAKIAPEVARQAILDYSSAGELVLDPMAGSGTVALEAALLKRRSIAIDLDPLAVLIARVKTLPLNGQAVNALLDLECAVWQVNEPLTSSLLDINFWFDRDVAVDLTRIRYALSRMRSPELRLLGAIAMSSMVVAKGTGSVANARDVAHSRAHRYKTPRVKRPDVMEIWPRRVKKLARILQGLELECQLIPAVALADARRLPIASDSVDLVVTSPPYFNAIDYPRAHKFSLAWLQGLFNALHIDYCTVSGELVGSVRARVPTSSGLDKSWLRSSATAHTTLRSLTGSLQRAFECYVDDIDKVVREISRVLKRGRHAFIVVADSSARGMGVRNHVVMLELASSHGLEVEIVGHREIDPSRRQMPIKGGLSGRIKREELLLLRKA